MVNGVDVLDFGITVGAEDITDSVVNLTGRLSSVAGVLTY